MLLITRKKRKFCQTLGVVRRNGSAKTSKCTRRSEDFRHASRTDCMWEIDCHIDKTHHMHVVALVGRWPWERSFPRRSSTSVNQSRMILTSIVLLAFRAGYALPEYHTPTSNAACHVLAVNDPKAQPLLRTLFGVAWNCVLTVFICAWTSVHPNVPPRNRTGGLLARVKLMFWTIVAPELVLAWAVRQWFAAREIRNIYNQHRGK